jgi:hypothetical protein
MRSIFVALLVLAPVALVYASDVPVDQSAAPALYKALENAGATSAPDQADPALLAINVTNLNCNGGYNEFTKKSESNCDFVNGEKHVEVKGTLASDLLTAMINTKIMTRGPAEESAGSVKSVHCTLRKFGVRVGQWFCSATN